MPPMPRTPPRSSPRFKAALPKRIRATRDWRCEADPDFALLEFDTAAELLYRFVDDLLAYAETYASLAVPTHERERWIARYVPKTNLLAASVSGLRATIVMLVLGAFWIATAWPSGGTMVLNAAAVCALASSSPRPTLMAFQMASGTLLATVAGMIVVFGLYPRIDGFLLLSAALVPFLLLGTYLSTRRSLVGVGIGYCIFFCFLAGPDNLTHYDPTGFINDAIALVLSMLVSSIAFAVLLPTDAPWLRRLLMSDLRREVVHALPRAPHEARDALRKPHARPAFADQRARRGPARLAARGLAVALRRARSRPRGDRPASRTRAPTDRASRRHAVAPCRSRRRSMPSRVSSTARTRAFRCGAGIDCTMPSPSCRHCSTPNARRAKSVTGCNAS